MKGNFPMKKQLFILLPALMILAACGSKTSVPSSSTTTATATTAATATVTTSVTIPKVTPVLHITVSGIIVDTTQNAVWVAGATIGSGTSSAWGYEKATYDDTLKTYDYTFKEVEAGEVINYKVYVDNSTTFAWKNVCSECAGNVELTLETAEGVSSYSQTCSFTGQPDVNAKVDSLKVTFTILDSSSSPLTLNSGVYVWMWDSLDNGTVVLSDNGDGTWSKSLKNVPIGTDALSVTPVLGSATAPNWSYKSSNYPDGYKFTIKSTDTEVTLSPKFADQPAAPTTTGVTVSVILNVAAGKIDTGAIPKLEWAGWTNTEMTVDSSDSNKWTASVANVAAGTYSVFFYYWISAAGDVTGAQESYLGSASTANTEAGTTKFSVTVAAAALTVTVNAADFTTHTGTLA
jgi:hypothetical protein